MATTKPDDDKPAAAERKAADKEAKAREKLEKGDITWRQFLEEIGQADLASPPE